jgi:RHS repeat-associated protein
MHLNAASSMTSQFTSKERDAETGLDYFGARYYSAAQGRFMTPDWSKTPTPVPYADFSDPQTLNLYSYVRNNPMGVTDPDGHGFLDWLKKQACSVGIDGACSEKKEKEEKKDDPNESKKEETQDEEKKSQDKSTSDLTEEPKTINAAAPFMGALAISGVLAGDDVTGIGVADDPLIPVVLVGGAIISTAIVVDQAIDTSISLYKEHTKNKSKSRKDKHEKVDSGQKKPPNYVPWREYKKPKK